MYRISYLDIPLSSHPKIDKILDDEYGYYKPPNCLDEWYWKNYQAKLQDIYVIFETKDGWVRFCLEWM